MVVMAVDEIGDSAAKVGEEPRAQFTAADDSPTHYGKIQHRIVASALPELFAKIACPVRAAQLPTVGGQIFQAAAYIGFCGGENRKPSFLPILIKPWRIQATTRQALPPAALGGEPRSRSGVAESARTTSF